MNYIVVTIYWTFLHKADMIRFKGQHLKQLNYYVAHTFPAIACFINVWCTGCVLRKESYKLILAFAIIYTPVLWLATIYSNEGLIYSFLTFKDYTTFLNISILVLAATGFHHIMCYID